MIMALTRMYMYWVIIQSSYKQIQVLHNLQAILKSLQRPWDLKKRLHAHQVDTNTQSGNKVISMLIWLAHAFEN